MGASSSPGLTYVALGVAATAVTFNAIGQWAFNYPLVYCLAGPPAAHLYSAWGLMVLYAVSAYIVLNLFRGQSIPVIGGAVIFIGIIELPRVAEYLFRLGGSCG